MSPPRQDTKKDVTAIMNAVVGTTNPNLAKFLSKSRSTMQLATKTEKTVKAEEYTDLNVETGKMRRFLRARRKFSEKSVDEAVKAVETGKEGILGGLVEEPKGMEETGKGFGWGPSKVLWSETEVIDKKVAAVEVTAAIEEGLKKTWVWRRRLHFFECWTRRHDILTDDEDALITLDDLREYISDDEDAGVRGVVSVEGVEGCRRGADVGRGLKGVLERWDGEEGSEAVIPPVQDDEDVNDEISITPCAELKAEKAVDVKEVAILKAGKVMEVGDAVDTTVPSVQDATNFDKETPIALYADLLEIALEAPIKAEMERSIHVTNEPVIMDNKLNLDSVDEDTTLDVVDASDSGDFVKPDLDEHLDTKEERPWTSVWREVGVKTCDVSDVVGFVEATDIEKDVAEFVTNDVEILPAGEAKGRACESEVAVAVETIDEHEDIGELVTDKVQIPVEGEVCDVLDFAVAVEPTDVVGLTTDEAQMFPVREVEVKAREVLDVDSSVAPTDVVMDCGVSDGESSDTDGERGCECLMLWSYPWMTLTYQWRSGCDDAGGGVELKAREDLNVAVVVEHNDVVNDDAFDWEMKDSDLNVQTTVKDKKEGEVRVDGAVAMLSVSSVNVEVSGASSSEKPPNAPTTPTPIIQTFPSHPSPTSPSRPLNSLPSHTCLHSRAEPLIP
ncbi:hypothetical protein BC829DRAFT_432077 [Chytridium lagenaria]|nr:hypothetical protein BC829DRAFT_432077 [Chytridium lagenaria]